MIIASLVIGIVSFILGFVPFCNYFATIPAIVGIILGVVGLTNAKKSEQPTGMAIAGIVLNAVAIVFILLWTFVIGAGVALSSY